jgi:hypothetical protein
MADQGDGDMVTFIQRIGRPTNLNIRLQCLTLDGMYRRGMDGGPACGEVPVPTNQALQTGLCKIVTHAMKLPTLRGAGHSSPYTAVSEGDLDEALARRPLQVVSDDHIASCPCAGQQVLTAQGAKFGEAGFKQDPCGDINGFSLHSTVSCVANDRKPRNRCDLCKMKGIHLRELATRLSLDTRKTCRAQRISSQRSRCPRRWISRLGMSQRSASCVAR